MVVALREQLSEFEERSREPGVAFEDPVVATIQARRRRIEESHLTLVKCGSADRFVQSEALGDPHVTVTASNEGRSPVTVKSWNLQLDDGRTIAIIEQAPWSAKLPDRLEAGDSAGWHDLGYVPRPRNPAGALGTAATPWSVASLAIGHRPSMPRVDGN